MKTNRGILTEDDIKKRTKFWDKKSFRTFSKKELEKDSKRMQLLILALKGLTLSEIVEVRKKRTYEARSEMENRIWLASESELDHAILTAPKCYNIL